MAGDWIKMRKSLTSDPKLVRIMSALNADRFRTLGGVLSAWCLLDDQTECGNLDGYTPEVFDSFVGFPGLCQAMIDVGWMRETSQGLEAVNFTEHNGQTAKRRAQESVRKMSARNADKSRTKSGLEKRREEKSNTHTHTQADSEFVPHLLDTAEFRGQWNRWKAHRLEKHKPLGTIEAESQLGDLLRFGPSEAAAVVDFSIRQGALNLITNGDHNRKPSTSSTGGSRQGRSKVSFEEGLLT
jgi:hypothetical protein